MPVPPGAGFHIPTGREGWVPEIALSGACAALTVRMNPADWHATEVVDRAEVKRIV